MRPGGKSAHLQNRRRGGEFCAAAGTSDEKVNEIIRSAEGDVLIVAHSGVNRVIMCSLMEKRAERYLPHRIRQRNVSDYGAVTAKRAAVFRKPAAAL